MIEYDTNPVGYAAAHHRSHDRSFDAMRFEQPFNLSDEEIVAVVDEILG